MERVRENMTRVPVHGGKKRNRKKKSRKKRETKKSEVLES